VDDAVNDLDAPFTIDTAGQNGDIKVRQAASRLAAQDTAPAVGGDQVDGLGGRIGGKGRFRCDRRESRRLRPGLVERMILMGAFAGAATMVVDRTGHLRRRCGPWLSRRRDPLVFALLCTVGRGDVHCAMARRCWDPHGSNSGYCGHVGDYACHLDAPVAGLEDEPPLRKKNQAPPWLV